MEIFQQESPLVSICIPAYNNQKYISITIESVLKQTYTNWELIIVDDASKDKTLAEIIKFNDPRIKVYSNNANLGLTANWNKTVSFASGKYVKLLCGDDVLKPDCIMRQVNVFEEYKDKKILLVSCYRDIINSNGNVILKNQYLRPGLHPGKKIAKKCIHFGTNLIGEPAVGLFKRESLNNSEDFCADNPYLIDLDFWFKLLNQGDLYVINDFLASFRISNQSVSTKIGFRQAQWFRRFIRHHLKLKTIRISLFDLAIGYVTSFLLGIVRIIIIIFQNKIRTINF